MPLESKNLGLVKAIHVGATAPTNTYMLWFDTSTGVEYHKYYDFGLNEWLPLKQLAIGDVVTDATADTILYVDTDGNLASGAFLSLDLNLTESQVLFGGADGSVEQSAYLTFVAADKELTSYKYDMPTTDNTGVGAIYQNNLKLIHTYGTDNIFFGISSGNLTLTATTSIAIGKNTLSAVTSATENTIIGHEAGKTLTTSSQNTFVGYGAGQRFNGTFGGNTFIGDQTGYGAVGATGYNNTAVGTTAFSAFTTGNNNTAIGTGSGAAILGGSYNSLLGGDSGQALTTGNYNVYIGHSAAEGNTTGSNNVIIGGLAGGFSPATYSGNVFIGYQAGTSESGSNKLYIENSNSTSPLIYGEFDNDLLKINGTLFVSNRIAVGQNSGMYNIHAIEENQLEIVGDSYGTTKVFFGGRAPGGTYASPTQTTSGKLLVEFGAGGYYTGGSSGFTASSTAMMRMYSSEAFSDTAQGTEIRFYVTPSGQTSQSLALTIGNDRTLQLRSSINEYRGITLANNGVLGSVGTPVSLTGQTAAIGATTCYTADEDGWYQVCWNASITTAATSSSVLGSFQTRYTSAVDNVVKTTPTQNNVTGSTSNTTGTCVSGVHSVYAKNGTAIQYIMGYTSSGATPMAYELKVTVVKL